METHKVGCFDQSAPSLTSNLIPIPWSSKLPRLVQQNAAEYFISFDGFGRLLERRHPGLPENLQNHRVVVAISQSSRSVSRQLRRQQFLVPFERCRIDLEHTTLQAGRKPCARTKNCILLERNYGQVATSVAITENLGQTGLHMGDRESWR